MNDITRFYGALGVTSGRVRIFSQVGRGKPNQSIIEVGDAPAEVARRAEAANVWLSTSSFGPDVEGSVANVIGVNAISVDLDAKAEGMHSMEACQALGARITAVLGIQPAVVVNSGHGLNVHWAIDDIDASWEPGDEATRQRWSDLFRRFRDLVVRLAGDEGDVDRSVFGIERIWRAPGTTNSKPDHGLAPVPTALVWCAEEPEALTYDEIDDAIRSILGDEPEPVAAPAVSTEMLGDVAGFPEALQRRLKGYTTQVVDGIALDLRSLVHDARDGWDNNAVRAAFRLVELAESPWCPLTFDQARQVLVDYMPTDPGFNTARVLKKFEQAMKRRNAGQGVPAPSWVAEELAAPAGPDADGADPAAANWRRHSWDDIGNAERLIALHGETLRWLTDRELWMEYRAGHWAPSKDAGQRCAIDTIQRTPRLEEEFYSDVKPPVTGKGKEQLSPREEFHEWVGKQRSFGKTRDAAGTARALGLLNVQASDFDTHPMAFNVRNGVINLNTGELVAHDPSLLLQQHVDMDYDPAAEAPEWEAFLAKVMPDQEMRNYLQRIVGYSITGTTSEQVMFMHHGKTKNGKSVFLRIIEAMLGNYSQVVPATTLLAKKQDQHPTDIARMEGKRMLQMSETPRGARLDEALIKRLSGQETITARGMGENFRDMQITGKVHLVTNHLPHISADEATKRRIRLIHWAVTIPEAERDVTLADRIIKNELSGVLAWAVRGTLEWNKHRLAPPAAAEFDAADYFSEEDEFQSFLEERTMKSDSVWETTINLFAAYLTWCQNSNVKPMSKIAFGRELAARGYEAKRTSTARGFGMVLTQHVSSDPFGLTG